MGVWGTGLFCNDVACDIRTQFRNLLEDGETVPRATTQILQDWKEAVEDAEDGPVVWLVLASLQWDRGGLQSNVRKKATRIIDNDVDIEYWRSTGNPRNISQRKTVLRKLRQKLESPQPQRKQKSVKRVFKTETSRKKVIPVEWKVGELIAYKLRSGNWILLHIVKCSHHRQIEDIYPTFAVLDWQGRDIPAEKQILKIPYKKPPKTTVAWGGAVAQIKERRAYCIDVAHRKLASIPVKRIQQLSMSKKPPFREPRGWFPGVLWSQFDAKLDEDLDLR